MKIIIMDGMKIRSFFIVLGLILILTIISWSDWLVDIQLTERNGNSIANAIENYQRQNHTPPRNLESLVPQYFEKLPLVKRKFVILPDKCFGYEIYNEIPLTGCFIINFMHQSDGRTYEYDSRENLFRFTGNSTNPDYIEENITFKDVELVSSKIESYYRDSLKYPEFLEELIPQYLVSLPYDTSARYKFTSNFSAELLEYKFYQPCDTFRGKFRLYFDVACGRYYCNNLIANVGGWSYDD